MTPHFTNTLIVGGGPAGTAVLMAADKLGRLSELLSAGLVLVEHGDQIGGGVLHRYSISSDTTAGTFLSAVRDSKTPQIAALATHPSANDIASYADKLGVPLSKVATFLDLIGTELRKVIANNGGSVLTKHEVTGSTQTENGLWLSMVRNIETGTEQSILSRHLVLATGGHQHPDALAAQQAYGIQLLPRYEKKLVQSDAILSHEGVGVVRSILKDKRAAAIAIMGGSTSALSVINVLLGANDLLDDKARISLIYRSPLRPFYPSTAAAEADGFKDFTVDDICPISGFVYRMGGFRLAQRALVLEILGINGRRCDARIKLFRGDKHSTDEVQDKLDRADLIITALGYQPRALPLFSKDGGAIALPLSGDPDAPLVDQRSRVLDIAGTPIPGLYGIGLAAGFRPQGILGGEPSFRGQANGLWLWQNGIGALIVEQLLHDKQTRAVA